MLSPSSHFPLSLCHFHTNTFNQTQLLPVFDLECPNYNRTALLLLFHFLITDSGSAKTSLFFVQHLEKFLFFNNASFITVEKNRSRYQRNLRKAHLHIINSQILTGAFLYPSGRKNRPVFLFSILNTFTTCLDSV